MRSLLGLSLLVLAAAHEHQCPIKGIIHWLKEHGAQAFETAKDCKDVPAAIMHSVKNKECVAEKSNAEKAAVAVWYAITGLEHMNNTLGEFVKHHSQLMDKVKALATKKVIAMAHKGVDKFCGNSQCPEKVEEVQTTIGSCYASLACDFLGKYIPFEPCKTAFDKYMSTTMKMVTESMCKSDDIDGKTYYCAELNSNLMYRDFDCFLEMKMQKGKCSPQCMQDWDAAKLKMPKCSKIQTDMSQNIFDNVKTLMEDVSKDAKIDMKKIVDKLPKHIPTYDERCPPKPQWYDLGVLPQEITV